MPKGPSFHEQAVTVPTDQLLAAYRGQRNPFNQANKLAPEGQQDVEQILRGRGVNLSGVTVTPGGTVHRSFGQKLGKIKPLHALGSIASKVAPLISLIPGAGTLAGGVLGAGGELLQGHGVGQALKKGALGAVAGGVGSKLLGGRGIGGISKLLANPSAALSRTGVVGSVANTALGAIKKDPLKAAQLGLAGLGTIQGAQQLGQANALRGRALQHLGSPSFPMQGPDLSSTFADVGNPYAGGGIAPLNTAQQAAAGALRTRPLIPPAVGR